MHRVLLLLFLIPSVSIAQFTYEFDQSIPCTVDSKPLKMAWAGGLNAAQYNTFDLNNDGIDDLVVFDRTSNKVNTFLADDNKYHYAPEYETFFPEGVNNWLIMKDYNCDGFKDIFTSSPFGIIAYKNTGADLPQWELDVDPVNTVGTSGVINLKINGSDLPAIIDLDGDGDLDILTFGFTGGGEVQYHQNMSMENKGDCSSLDFVRLTQRWGDFKECQCGEFAFGAEDCPTSGGRVEHTSGKSLLAFDADGDSDFDLVVGEEDCQSLHLLTNVGSNEFPIMGNPVAFPNSSPVDLYHFPVAFLEDVNFDGINDLIVSTNAISFSQGYVPFEASNWLYDNNGTNDNPTFNLVQKNFLQDEMIDLGQDAVPAFFDHDGDGDLDLFICSKGQQRSLKSYYSSIFLFENIGNSSQPEYELANDDYGNASILKLLDMTIQFADINGDGNPDLVISGIPLTQFSATITYVPNQSASGLNLNWQQSAPINQQIFSYDSHYFYDLNGDSYADLLLGKNNGNLEYYESTAQKENLQFQLIDDSFYDIDVSFTNRNLVPTIADLNNDGKLELITTDGLGELIIYDNFLENLETPKAGIKNTYYNSLTEKEETTHLGVGSWPAVADLYYSGTPSIILGTTQGGLQILKNIAAAPPGSLRSGKVLLIYPNPGTPIINNGEITIKSFETINLRIVSVLGKEVLPSTLISANSEFSFYMESLQSGVYLALAYNENGLVDKERFIVIR